jgi:hypothetical protein
LQHAQGVPVEPVLGDLAVRDVEDADPRDHHGLPSRGNAPQLSSMGATSGPADHDPVSFPNHLLHGKPEVGEDGAVHRDGVFFALDAPHPPRRTRVVDRIDLLYLLLKIL